MDSNPFSGALNFWSQPTQFGLNCELSTVDCELPLNSYTLNELPQPQVLFTFGLLNLKPAPSIVSM